MKVLNFPELRQTYNYDCGACATQGILDYYGIDVREGKLIKMEKTMHTGTRIKNIKKLFRFFDLKYKEKQMNIQNLKYYVDKQIPVMIVLQGWSGKKKTNWKKDWIDGHYVVVIGYSDRRIYFEDPSAERRTYLSYSELKKRWHDIDIKKKKVINWGLAVWRPKNSKKNPHPILSVDYRTIGERNYKKRKSVHMD